MSERGCGYVISEVVQDLALKRTLKKLAEARDRKYRYRKKRSLPAATEQTSGIKNATKTLDDYTTQKEGMSSGNHSS